MNVKQTLEFAADVHLNQKYGNLPFIVHPILVARHFRDETLQIVALLHDVVEETGYPLRVLFDMFGAEITDAVDAISRRKGEEYFAQYIQRVAGNRIATLVEIWFHHYHWICLCLYFKFPCIWKW